MCLCVQEGRLRKQREKDTAEQQQRKALEEKRMREAGNLYEDAQRAGQPFDPAEFGFEFSIDQIRRHAQARKDQARIAAGNYYQFKKRQEAA